LPKFYTPDLTTTERLLRCKQRQSKRRIFQTFLPNFAFITENIEVNDSEQFTGEFCYAPMNLNGNISLIRFIQ
jgi:hypothetical protein